MLTRDIPARFDAEPAVGKVETYADRSAVISAARASNKSRVISASNATNSAGTLAFNDDDAPLDFAWVARLPPFAGGNMAMCGGTALKWSGSCLWTPGQSPESLRAGRLTRFVAVQTRGELRRLWKLKTGSALPE